MTQNQAENLGLRFTGTCWSIYETDKAEQCKAKASALKKKYKGIEYVIVTGSKNSWLGSGSKGIWANDVYNKVQYYRDDTLQNKLNNIEKQKINLEQQLAKLEQDRLAAIAMDEEIKKLLKK